MIHYIQKTAVRFFRFHQIFQKDVKSLIALGADIMKLFEFKITIQPT